MPPCDNSNYTKSIFKLLRKNLKARDQHPLQRLPKKTLYVQLKHTEYINKKHWSS